MCRKQPGIAIGRLCDKCDGKCPVCDSYVRPTTLVRICDECSFGNYQNKCVVCGGEVRKSLPYLIIYPPLFFALSICFGEVREANLCVFFVRVTGYLGRFLLFRMYAVGEGSGRVSEDYQPGQFEDGSLLPEEEL